MQALQIRNSTIEFLIFTRQNQEKTIDVIVDDVSPCEVFDFANKIDVVDWYSGTNKIYE